jgi:Phosphotransferase enzyme family
MHLSAQLDLAGVLVESLVGQVARRISPLGGGQVGRVFRADTTTASYLVKFVNGWAEPDFEDEPVDHRVYGARFDNLRPAYDLLREAGLPTPPLHGCGENLEQGVFYAVFDYLDGDPDDFSTAWFSAVGASLRELHVITRPYQGWIGMRAPLPEAWPSAFQRALAINLAKAKPVLPPSLAIAVDRRVREAPPIDDPHEFVLSHTDGFQALLKQRGERWEVLGHIDVEDFQFTDRRFVLTGFELAHRLGGRLVPEAFWRAYGWRPAQRHVQFELLYLLVWARVLQSNPESFAACIEELERVVG